MKKILLMGTMALSLSVALSSALASVADVEVMPVGVSLNQVELIGGIVALDTSRFDLVAYDDTCSDHTAGCTGGIMATWDDVFTDKPAPGTCMACSTIIGKTSVHFNGLSSQTVSAVTEYGWYTS